MSVRRSLGWECWSNIDDAVIKVYSGVRVYGPQSRNCIEKSTALSWVLYQLVGTSGFSNVFGHRGIVEVEKGGPKGTINWFQTGDTHFVFSNLCR